MVFQLFNHEKQQGPANFISLLYSVEFAVKG